MDIQLKRGLLDVCVLASIQDADSYGYKIIKDMKPYIMSAEQVAVATCPHSKAVGICKNGFSETFLLNAGIIHCVFPTSIMILVGKVQGFCGETAITLALKQRKIVL